VRDHERGRTFPLEWDRLCITTGAAPVRPDLPGIDLPSVRGVQTLDDASDLLAQMDRGGCRRVVVVGGGYIGLEMAEAFVRHGADVLLLEGGQQLMHGLDPDMAERLLAPLHGLGVEVRLRTRAVAFEEGRVHLDDGTEVPTDLAVLGLGVQPNAALAAGAGLATGAHGAIAVDRRQRTSAPEVYAAGDCCTSHHLVSGRQVHVALGTIANKQGRVAGTNLAGGYATFPGLVGTAITKVCHLDVARTGLTGREVAAAGLEADAAVVEGRTHASYISGVQPMTVKLLDERVKLRLLGGPMVGAPAAVEPQENIAPNSQGR
jgi:NADPH-dependent 2,4-dienoyl-CoA reductase/sulfur reductase-like enzyme